MFAISTRPPLAAMAITDDFPSSSTHKRHPDEVEDMDIDEMMADDADEAGFSGEGVGRSVVGPGEGITSSKEYMRGHGTYVEDEQVVSSVAGTIERVNKLISVKPLKSRYTPEVGDLVIGRIVEVGSSRWKVDANARQDAVLMLSSVNLPGGVQRRKVEEDALKMREFLAEGDLLVAEVQAFFGDGAMSLHTRSLKYGKLRNGQLVIIPPHLIRRLKSHFHHLPPPCGPKGVDVIIGLNGLMWVSQGTEQESADGQNGAGAGAGVNVTAGVEGLDATGVYSNVNDEVLPASRAAISTISTLIRLFAKYDIPISDTLLLEGYSWMDEHARAQAEGRREGAGVILTRTQEERLIGDIVGVDVSGSLA